jgi:hypothetical protein
MRLTSDLNIPEAAPNAWTRSSTFLADPPVKIGLHRHREERPVDTVATFQDGREEAPSSELGDGQIHVARLGRQQSRAVAISLVGPGLAALVRPGPDGLGRLGFDQSLEGELDRSPDLVDVTTITERVEQLTGVK